jgi:hypothetical protein
MLLLIPPYIILNGISGLWIRPCVEIECELSLDQRRSENRWSFSRTVTSPGSPFFLHPPRTTALFSTPLRGILAELRLAKSL